MSRREADCCFKCGRATPWDEAIAVPTAQGNPRTCCLSCGLILSGSIRRRMSQAHQRKLSAYAFGSLPRRTLGLTPRKAVA